MVPSQLATADAGAVTTGLMRWIEDRLPGEKVVAESNEGGVSIHLAGLAPRIVPHHPLRKSAVLALDYLIAARQSDPLEAHRAVGELAFAALDHDEYQLVGDASVAEISQRLGMAPAPGIVIRVELRREAVRPSAPLVRHPPLTRLEPLDEITGLVVGPGGTPIANALVLLTGSNRSVTTGPDGRFRFAIPAGSPAQVTARARSRKVLASLDPGSTNIISLPMEA
jgi:hypothetical protein